MATATLSSMFPQTISPIDALWSLYQSQSKRVRRAFRVRILAEEAEEAASLKMKAYEHKLSTAEREAAYHLADTIKKGVAEVDKARLEQRSAGRSAEEFLSEMQKGMV